MKYLAPAGQRVCRLWRGVLLAASHVDVVEGAEELAPLGVQLGPGPRPGTPGGWGGVISIICIYLLEKNLLFIFAKMNMQKCLKCNSI